MKQISLIFFLFIILITAINLQAQEDEDPIFYYQMEPLDDSLFILIQETLFIDPPDPKAEIIVDLRDPNNQTISVRGALYPFLALPADLRAKVITYPFKINLEETVHFGSVFTKVIERLRLSRVLNTPSVYQISPALGYINPFIQVQGGERFGIPLKTDVGISFGFGTPYSGVLETNFIEANFHILGFRAGIFQSANTFVELKEFDNHNNLFVSNGFQISYVVPFGNFFEFGYLSASQRLNETQILKYTKQTVNKDNIVLNPDGTIRYQPYLLDTQSFINWEFRYPIRILGSTRGKIYVARFIDEMHIGYSGREHTLGGSVFDFRFDAMFNSPVRQPQYVVDIMVQKIFDMWASSAIAVGPSAIVGTKKNGSLGITSILFNLRIKVGTSL
ncbi:MAG: hypothetical protein KGZ85_10965 [Ignavibacterium sp.]|nr:hypothetical protein [Ignavibacterium sp.]